MNYKQMNAHMSRKMNDIAKKSSIKTTGTFHGKSNELGGGGRFAQVEAAAAASGASNPAAVAAAVGRKKYGAKKMAKMAAVGRRRSMK